MDNYDIYYDIFKNLNFLSQLAFKFTSRAATNNLSIRDLYAIDPKYMARLTESIIITHFPNVVSLNINHDNYTSFSFLRKLKNLKRLDIWFNDNISQADINGLDLTELQISDSNKIYDVSFMRNLKVLRASLKCGLDNAGISGLDLYELYVGENPNITNIAFMQNLKLLSAWGKSGIDDMAIQGLDLYELDMASNYRITDITHLKNLKKLYINKSSHRVKLPAIDGLDIT